MQNRPFANSDSIVATRRHVSQTVAGEVVILHLDDGAYYGLNEVGTRVWQLLQKPHTPDQIVSDIVSEFEVSADECTRDILELLDALLEKGLVERHSEEL